MHQDTPNDSILLPEGIVPDDMNVIWLNTAFADIVNGALLEKENSEEKEAENHADQK